MRKVLLVLWLLGGASRFAASVSARTTLWNGPTAAYDVAADQYAIVVRRVRPVTKPWQSTPIVRVPVRTLEASPGTPGVAVTRLHNHLLTPAFHLRI